MQDLLRRHDTYGEPVVISTPPAIRNDFFRLFKSEHRDIRGLLFLTTPEAYLKHVQICDRFALKANLANSEEPYFEFYTVDPAISCQIAVDISLPAKYLSREPKLTIASANHLSDLSICGELLYLNLQ